MDLLASLRDMHQRSAGTLQEQVKRHRSERPPHPIERWPVAKRIRTPSEWEFYCVQGLLVYAAGPPHLTSKGESSELVWSRREWQPQVPPSLN